MSIKNKVIVAATAASMAVTMVLPTFAHAQSIGSPQQAAKEYLSQAGKESGLNQSLTLPQLIGRIINIVLGLLGLIFLALAVYAGYNWMTAGGDTKKIDESKNTLTNAIIGLIIIFAAYAITNFVINDIVFTATS